MLQLTSYERMRRYLATSGGDPLNDTRPQRQDIVRWILSASRQIEKYLKRELKLDSYTEYYDVIKPHWVEYFVRAYPITVLTDVYVDSSGQYDGDESEVDDCITTKHESGIVLPNPPSILGKKVLRIRYTGGLALDGVKSVFACTFSGAWSNNNFALGETSGAVGIVKSTTASSITIENLYGIFEDGETLTEYTDELITTATGETATVTAITSQSLAEAYPDITAAAEIQVRHYWKHKTDFELTGTNKDGTNIRRGLRRSLGSVIENLTDEATSFLRNYKRIVL